MGNFTVGTAKLDITPNLGCHLAGYFNDRIATSIHDPLFVKAIAINDGENEIGLVTLDIISITASIVQQAKALITERTGVSGDQILVSATHTHTGPAVKASLGTPTEPGYAESLVAKIADAFTMAHNARVPALIAHGYGNVAEEVHNRRWHMKNGSVQMNPGYCNPNAIRPAGPTDPQLGFLIACDPVSRKPIALYANLALHYVGATSDHNTVSADYFGCFAAAMQRMAGSDFLVLLANGTQGNINNCDFTKPPRESRYNFQQCERVANVCAAEVWKNLNLLRDDDFKAEGTVGAKLHMIPFKSRMPSDEQLAEAKKIYAENPNHDSMEWIYAQELVLLSQMPKEYDIPLHTLHVNDLGIVGLFGEVFVEIGLDIKQRSPFPQTMVVGIANGTTGYIATDLALDEGSYETRLCRHVHSPKGTGKFWADTAVDDLKSLL